MCMWAGMYVRGVCPVQPVFVSVDCLSVDLSVDLSLASRY